MQSYVYHTHVAYTEVDKILTSIKSTVKELRETRPELKLCELADVGMTNGKRGMDITLYFQEKVGKSKLQTI